MRVHRMLSTSVCLQSLKEKAKIEKKNLRVPQSEKSRQCLSWSPLGNSTGT